MTNPLPADLNPGIAAFVQALNDAGFRTSDSGDGFTHQHACDRSFAFVAILATRDTLLQQTSQLVEFLQGRGSEVVALTQKHSDLKANEVVIHATYDPANDVALIDVELADGHREVIGRPEGLPPQEPTVEDQLAEARAALLEMYSAEDCLSGWERDPPPATVVRRARAVLKELRDEAAYLRNRERWVEARKVRSERNELRLALEQAYPFMDRNAAATEMARVLISEWDETIPEPGAMFRGMPSTCRLAHTSFQGTGEMDELGFEKPKRMSVNFEFTEKRCGFGEFDIIVDEAGQVFVDTEHMGKRALIRAFATFLDGAITEYDDEPAKHKAYDKARRRNCARCPPGAEPDAAPTEVTTEAPTVPDTEAAPMGAAEAGL